MALQNYATQSGRINKLLGEILAHAIPVEVTGQVGVQKPIPSNKGDTVIFRRWIPVGSSNVNQFFANGTGDRGNALVQSLTTSEGVSPNVNSLSAQDYSVTLQQIAIGFGYSDKMADLYEDDVPSEMKAQVGQQLGLAREMMRFGAIKGVTNKFYGGTGTTRATVNGKITLNILRKIARSLKANHAEQINKALKSDVAYGTVSVEPSYVVFCHTDLEADIRDLPKFKSAYDYGQGQNRMIREIGTCEDFRFVTSPELIPVQDGGAAVGATGLASTTGTNIDVYQVIMAGKDAWGQVMLRGENAAAVNWLKPNQVDKNDMFGQRGYVTAKNYFNAVVLNPLWVAVAEVGVTAY